MARTPNVAPNKGFEPMEQIIGQDKPLDIPVEGSISGIIRTDQQVEAVEGLTVAAGLDALAAALAFMEEPVDIMVHESTDPNAELIVDVYCNGVPQRFIRGQAQTVKRKFVEVLSRAKQTSIQTETAAQDANGNVVNRINRHTALRYPFSIVFDANPNGRDWIKSVLREA